MSADGSGNTKKEEKRKKAKKRKRHDEKESEDGGVEKRRKEEQEPGYVGANSQKVVVGSTSETSNHDGAQLTKKKKRKRRSQKDGDAEDVSSETRGDILPTAVSLVDCVSSERGRTEQGTESSKKATHKARREERKRLISQLPITDERGIAYTKQQLRRMRKRLSRGLDPIESPEEAKARLAQEAELKRQEDEELSGLIYEKEQPQVETDEESGSGDEDMQRRSVGIDRAGDAELTPGTTATTDVPTHSATPKKKREKPLPSDYVCQACQNVHQPAHWIYDCPRKVTVRGTNRIAKKHKGIHNPLHKVFLSGLPFDAKPKDVQNFFQECGKVVHCKLLKFEDTGRCRGQAYVSFETDEAARKALSLNDTLLKREKVGGKNLRLKVTKALNRTVTKAKATTSVLE